MALVCHENIFMNLLLKELSEWILDPFAQIGMFVPAGASLMVIISFFVIKLKNDFTKKELMYIWFISIFVGIKTCFISTTYDSISVHKIDFFSLIIIVRMLFLNFKNSPKKISPLLIYMLSFFNGLIIDLWKSSTSVPDFHIRGIGGGGIIDSLFISPLLAAFAVFMINKLIDRKKLEHNLKPLN
jgi:hypothetical protein